MEPEIKQKRKYTRKVKIEVEEPKEPKPKRKYTKKAPVEVMAQLSEAESDSEELVEKMKELKTIDQIMEEVYVRGYEKVVVYIYYAGHLIDTMKYIKEFQLVLDSHRIGSQVVINTIDAFHKVGINNCFLQHLVMDDWTSLSLAKTSFCAIKIKERPAITPVELFELITSNSDYEDDHVVVCEIKK